MNKQLNRFWNKVEKTDTCWNWKGSVMGGKLKYGHINLNFKHKYAHRVSWEIHFGKIPTNKQVLHKCDNPLCVNPKHLWLGTHQENMADRDKKGRFIPSYGNTKLNENQVKIIKKEFKNKTVKELANKFSVHISTIYHIKIGLTWENV